MSKVTALDETNVRPLIGYVLVRRIVEDETKGGLVLPDISKNMPNEDGTLPKRGTVLKTSRWRMEVDVSEDLDRSLRDRWEKTKQVPLQVKVGDVVHFNKYGGRPFCDDEDLILIHEREILAVEEVAGV